MPRKHPIIAVVLLSAVPALASPGARPPPADSDAPPALLELRGKLAEAGEAKARRQMARFRPLCDADGYPLVGNLANKGSMIYKPSQFCAEVRRGKR